MSKKQKKIRIVAAFFITGFLLCLMFLLAVNTGSLNVSGKQLWEGLFVAFDETVAAVYHLRFPRIVISIFIGGALAVSGVLLQAVLRNPLTDPGVIGITGGAALTGVIFTAIFPGLLGMIPIASCIGGITAFLLVYSLSWKGGLSPLRIVLVGVAASTMFSGVLNAFNTLSGERLSGVAAIVEGNITAKTWTDVRIIVYYLPIALILALCFTGKCNLLALDDKTARGIGLNVDRYRLLISLVAVVLASVSTAVAGSVSFVGLLVPHIGRIFVGSNHKVLIPYSFLLGALLFLSADTVGRMIAPPYEVNASIIMAVIGGPFFIVLLKRRANI